MTPSNRISIIQQIAKSLSSEDWSIIDLTLKQHELPWTETWSGNDKIGYVVAMIEDAPDSTLIQLGNHLGLIAGSITSPDCWKGGQFRLFISHVSKYKSLANTLREALDKCAISGFVAHVDIEPTREWQNEIETALHTSDALLALLTPGFHESNWTDQEVGVAIGRGVLVLPVRLELDPYGFIGRNQALQGYHKEPLLLAHEIFSVLAKHDLTRRNLAEAVVYSFEHSNSWQQAKDDMQLLERFEQLEPHLLDRIRQAVEENMQVREAFGVPGKVNRLEQKHLSRENIA